MTLFPTYPLAPWLCHPFLFLYTLSVDEGIPLKHPGDEPVALESLPGLLGLAGELEDHGQGRQPRTAAPCFVGSQPHRRKG